MTLCRVFERPDGTVAVVHPAPDGRLEGESEAAWLKRVWARTAEANPDLADLPFHDLDPTALPPKTAPCTDGCGEDHPVRNQWRVKTTGKRRAIVVDSTVRNLHAEHRHLEHAEEHALDQDDGMALAKIAAAKEQFKRHFVEGLPPPKQEVVERLTAEPLAERKDRASR